MENQTAAHPCCDLVRRSTVSVGIFTSELFPESDCRTVCAWDFLRRKTGGGAYHDFPAGKRHYDQFLWHGYGCVCGFHACHGIRAFNFISRVKNVAAGGLWDHDRLYLFRHHGLWRHICQRFEYRQSSQLVDGKFFRHDMGKYKNDRRDRRRSSACDFLSGKTDRGISDGGGICQKYWCQCKSIEGHDDPFIKPSVCLRDCICGTDLLCRNCSAASGEDGDKNSAPDYPDSGVFFVWCSCDTFL